MLTSEKLSGTKIGSVISILFDGARVDLQNQDAPQAATWVGTFRIPVSSSKAVTYIQHLRGFVGKDANSRVLLVLDLGSKSHVVEYPFGWKISKQIFHKFVSSRAASAGDYTATLFIFVERRNTSSAVAVNVDSLDVEAFPGKIAKGK